jgi:peptidoglycan/LPS O-acetylase OafA/YrhL
MPVPRSAREQPNLARASLAVLGVLLLGRALLDGAGLSGPSQVLGAAWIVAGAGVPLACLVQVRQRADRTNRLATVLATLGYAVLAAYAVLTEPAPTDVGGGLVVLVGLMLMGAGGLMSQPPEPAQVP